MNLTHFDNAVFYDALEMIWCWSWQMIIVNIESTYVIKRHNHFDIQEYFDSKEKKQSLNKTFFIYVTF